MTAMAKREPSIMEVCIARKGVLKGSRVCSFIVSWCLASQALGREITLEEYREWWRESERTAYRHQADFRQVFPHLPNPQPIADVAIARSEAITRGVKGLGAVPVSLVPA
jgi:hypothetical protein